MTDRSIYEELGVTTVVNAAGTKTRIGGSRIRPAAREAMTKASESFVRLSDLQATASERIATITGAEAGYVTNGAAGGLMLATAACLAGGDYGSMQRLPDTEGIADEVIMPRAHRIGYDHAIRTAGATIIDIGTNDRRIGTGSRNVKPWEYADAITDETAAVGHVYKPCLGPDLADVCDIAHEYDVPVIVDAAAELPPSSNLSWFTEQGADLVVFSGGKGIRGPQTTGILAGRADLISSVATQHLDMHTAPEVWEPPTSLFDPDHLEGVAPQGIGRPLKVGKEELVGLLCALKLFIEEDHEQVRTKWRHRAERIAEELADEEVLETKVTAGEKSVTSVVTCSIDDRSPLTATDLVATLRQENPRIVVSADDLSAGRFTINPMCLTDAETDYVIDRIRVNVPGHEDLVADIDQEGS